MKLNYLPQNEPKQFYCQKHQQQNASAKRKASEVPAISEEQIVFPRDFQKLSLCLIKYEET